MANVSPSGNSARQNVQSLGAGGLYGPYASGGGGGVPVARSEIDASRMAIGRVPSAEYPDGYLGNVKSRRSGRSEGSSASDVVLDSLKNRLTQRSYQRGVHKGERIDPSDYLWPAAWDPQRGLMSEARGSKTTLATQISEPVHLVNSGKTDMRANQPTEINPMRNTFNNRLRPAWR